MGWEVIGSELRAQSAEQEFHNDPLLEGLIQRNPLTGVLTRRNPLPGGVWGGYLFQNQLL